MNRTGRTVSLLVLLGIIASAAAYQLAFAERIYPGVSTDHGLNLSSLTRQDAASALDRHADPYLERDIRLRFADKEWTVPPATLGVRSNTAGVLEAAFLVGRQGSIFQQWGDQAGVLTSGRVLGTPMLIIEDAKVSSFVSALKKEIDRPTIDARLVVDPNYQVGIAPSQVGRELDIVKTTQTLARTALNPSTDAVELPVTESPPTVKTNDLEQSKTSVARMLSAPLVLEFSGRTWTLSRQEIARLLGIDSSTTAGATRPVGLDGDKLAEYVRGIAEAIDQAPAKPRLDFNSGKLRVIREGKPGYQLDQKQTIAAIQAQVASDGRTIKLPVQVTMPPGLAADQTAIKELVSTATTNYGGGISERLFNVELAATKLNGVVVGPGDTFSFNEELGPMTLEAGFKWGWGITQSNGKPTTIPSVAGGICQVSTTLFQAIFWGGYQIEERNWHLYWIDRYGQPPAGLKGLDATVDQTYDANGNLVSAVDLKFKNTTQYPILIQAKTDGANLTFSLYSTKPNWEVKVDPPKIEDVVKADPEVVREEEPSLAPGKEIWIEAAQDGFKSTIVRTVLEEGKEPRVLRLVSTYQPSRNVLGVGPSTEPTPKPKGP